MDRFSAHVGRHYRLFDYSGDPQADRVIAIMGSGGDTIAETVRPLNERGGRVGVLQVRLYRPFAADRLIAALTASVRAIAVLDRTKEPGSAGEPLYKDVVTAIHEAGVSTRIVGGRYGLSSKEFTPPMVKAVFDNLTHATPKNHFTIGIDDDVTHTSLTTDDAFDVERTSTIRCRSTASAPHDLNCLMIAVRASLQRGRREFAN
jgi:pyruvate-ferredoxin/flavodoxin oxidoreductase